MKKFIKQSLRDSLGIEVQRVKPAPTESRKGTKTFLYETDPDFIDLYEAARKKTDTKPSIKRLPRFYNLLHLFRQIEPLSGFIAECGCWRGLSSLMLLSELRRLDPQYRGAEYLICDSFSGLSEPSNLDVIRHPDALKTGETYGVSGDFSCSQEVVQENLSEFPEVTYQPGWIPESLQSLPERTYRFVHVDLDLHEPTAGAVEYFYPRLIAGGMLVCDDYGTIAWPGARRAVDEYCQTHKVPLLPLSTGQAVLYKTPN
jgi:O-methyltransferase